MSDFYPNNNGQFLIHESFIPDLRYAFPSSFVSQTDEQTYFCKLQNAYFLHMKIVGLQDRGRETSCKQQQREKGRKILEGSFTTKNTMVSSGGNDISFNTNLLRRNSKIFKLTESCKLFGSRIFQFAFETAVKSSPFTYTS